MDAITQRAERSLFTSLRAESSRERRESAWRRYLPLARSLASRYRYTEEPIVSSFDIGM